MMMEMVVSKTVAALNYLMRLTAHEHFTVSVHA
jgi:hypothetical protein